MPTRSAIIRARRRAVGGKRDRCRKGKSCSAACINSNKFCLVDAPTPVAGALPRAVRAVQTRRESISPKEKRQILQKRREGVKTKIQQRAEFNRSRERYIGLRKTLRSKIEKAILDYDSDKASKLIDRLNKLEASVGSKLGVPKLKPIGEADKDRVVRAGARFNRAVSDIHGGMREAAETGNRREYDRLEKKLLRIEKKGGAMWEDLKNYYSWAKDFSKGSVWKSEAESRDVARAESLRNVHDKLMAKAQKAAWENDTKGYKRLEKAIMKIQSKRWDKLGLDDSERLAKGKLWERMRLQRYGPAVLDKIKADMEQAAISNDRKKYDKLEAKLFRVRDKMGPDLTDRSLRDMSGGEMWEKTREKSGKNELLSRLNNSDLNQGREGVKDIKVGSDERGINVSSSVLGNKLDVLVSPYSTSFKVNGSHTATDDLSRTEKVAIIREVTRQYIAIVKNLKDGMVLYVSAAEGDGKEDTRKKAYVGFGFSKPDEDGFMYGRVKNGKIIPIGKEEFALGKKQRFD